MKNTANLNELLVMKDLSEGSNRLFEENPNFFLLTVISRVARTSEVQK
jgi:hypothetical protein